jgi:hypothetical protein
MEKQETWKSPRRIQEEADAAYEAQQQARRDLRMKVGTALCDVILDGLMKPKEAKKVYRNQFPETVEIPYDN